MIPCVVLASVPIPGSKQLSNFQEEYADFTPGVVRTFPHEIQLCEYETQDGGNGGGGEPGGAPMKPSISEHGCTFWDFRYYPGHEEKDKGFLKTEARKESFPPEMRFELCLHFQDISYANAWLADHPAGKRLGACFKYVQVVAISTPCFVGTVSNPTRTDGYAGKVNTHWIGTSA